MKSSTRKCTAHTSKEDSSRLECYGEELGCQQQTGEVQVSGKAGASDLGWGEEANQEVPVFTPDVELGKLPFLPPQG